MNTLQAAIKYAKQGFYVLPMDGKRPLIRFADQPPLTIDQINYYWSKWPAANVALRTVDFFVVDIDTKEAHGANGLQSLKQLPQGVITATLAQTTASGGYQLFYKKPAGESVKQIIGWQPGIDIKAHVNNYVVVPPSTTNKGQYRWINDQAPMKPPSKQLLGMIDNYQPQQPSEYRGTRQALNNKHWAGRVLDNLVTGAPAGQRNDYLTRVCGQLIKTGAERSTVWQMLNYANEHNSPPLPSKELGSILSSVIKEELKHYH